MYIAYVCIRHVYIQKMHTCSVYICIRAVSMDVYINM